MTAVPPPYPGQGPVVVRRGPAAWVVVLLTLAAVALLGVVFVAGVLTGGYIAGQGEEPTAGPPEPSGVPEPGTSGDPGSGGTGSLDPCLVGTWEAVEHEEDWTTEEHGPASLSGLSRTMEFTSDGTQTITYDGDEGTITTEKGPLPAVFDGVVTYRTTTSGGTMSFELVEADGTVTVTSPNGEEKIEDLRPGTARSSTPVRVTVSGRRPRGTCPSTRSPADAGRPARRPFRALLAKALHLGERVSQLTQPLVGVAADQVHAPGEGLRPATGDAGIDQGVEHHPLVLAQTGHHRNGQRGEELVGVADAHSPGDRPAVAVLGLRAMPMRRSRVSSRKREMRPVLAAAVAVSSPSTTVPASSRVPTTTISSRSTVTSGAPVNQSPGRRPLSQASRSSVPGGGGPGRPRQPPPRGPRGPRKPSGPPRIPRGPRGPPRPV